MCGCSRIATTIDFAFYCYVRGLDIQEQYHLLWDLKKTIWRRTSLFNLFCWIAYQLTDEYH